MINQNNLSEVEEIMKRLRIEVHQDFNLVNADEVSKELHQLIEERDYARLQAVIERDRYCHPDHGGHLFKWETTISQD